MSVSDRINAKNQQFFLCPSFGLLFSLRIFHHFVVLLSFCSLLLLADLARANPNSLKQQKLNAFAPVYSSSSAADQDAAGGFASFDRGGGENSSPEQSFVYGENDLSNSASGSADINNNLHDGNVLTGNGKSASGTFSGVCSREFGNVTSKGRTPGDNGFKIKITGNPEKYTPGELYTVVLLGHDTNYLTQKFIGFQLLVESRDHTTTSNVGSFQLFGDALTKVSDGCPNAITHTSLIPKSEIQVMWQAPPTRSGCVVFKATIMESTSTYFMDDGALTRHMCEQESESLDEQPEILNECCACDEAKFEMIFEGLWSKYTHPREFPSNELLTHFSEVIGASHSSSFRMWEYGGYASEGLRQVAEMGVTKKLEAELKSESDKIRTIIKARGLWHPNLNGKTFAVFRVDRKHHLMSLVSMLGPSPDWIVGVSALELCLPNCSWTAEKQMNLYLWDAGTDSGVSYLSPNQPTIPQERIRRITPTSPSSSDSPFFDPNSLKMRPFARLTVTRQRLYEKSCNEPPGVGVSASVEPDPTSSGLVEPKIDLENPYTSFGFDRAPVSASYPDVVSGTVGPSSLNPLRGSECATTEWTEWTPCSATCGEGHRVRTRNFLYEAAARRAGCDRSLTERSSCSALCVQGVSCATTSWSEWSECSSSCGKGRRTRQRRFMNRAAVKLCSGVVNLVEREACVGRAVNTSRACLLTNGVSTIGTSGQLVASTLAGLGGQTDSAGNVIQEPNLGGQVVDPLLESSRAARCAVTTWSEWSPCAVTCGKGIKIRTRLYISASAASNCDVELIQRAPCVADKPVCTMDMSEAKEVCLMPKEVGPCRGYFPRWYYDLQKGMCLQFIFGGCRGNLNNFERYTQCNKQCEIMLRDFIIAPLPSSTIAYAYTLKNATVHLEKGLVCAPISALTTYQPKGSLISSDEPVVDCVVSEWSEWSECSRTCGTNGRKERHRTIQQHSQNGGKACPSRLVQRRKCRNNPPCEGTHSSAHKHHHHNKN